MPVGAGRLVDGRATLASPRRVPNGRLPECMQPADGNPDPGRGECRNGGAVWHQTMETNLSKAFVLFSLKLSFTCSKACFCIPGEACTRQMARTRRSAPDGMRTPDRARMSDGMRASSGARQKACMHQTACAWSAACASDGMGALGGACRTGRARPAARARRNAPDGMRACPASYPLSSTSLMRLMSSLRECTPAFL